jgi:hypothetical protein
MCRESYWEFGGDEGSGKEDLRMKMQLEIYKKC